MFELIVWYDFQVSSIKLRENNKTPIDSIFMLHVRLLNYWVSTLKKNCETSDQIPNWTESSYLNKHDKALQTGQ